MSLSISTTHRWHRARSLRAIASNARSTALVPLTAGLLRTTSSRAAAVGANVDDARAQVQLNGDAERVEAAAEIGDRTGDENLVNHVI